MKTMLDRVNPLYGTDYAYRDIYLLTTVADGEESAMEGAVVGMQGFISCFEKVKLAGTIFGGNADEKGNRGYKEEVTMLENSIPWRIQEIMGSTDY